MSDPIQFSDAQERGGLSIPRLPPFGVAFRLASFLLALAWLLLPLGADAQVLNGDFESGSASWTAVDHFPVFSNSARANNGSNYAYTGVNQSLTAPLSGKLWQNITIPGGLNSATLEFYLWVASDEAPSGQFDILQVQILNATGTQTFQAEAGYYSNMDKAGSLSSTQKAYVKRSISLNSYIGQTIRVQFKSTVDSTLHTIFRIDDVVLVTTQALPNLAPYQPSGWSNKIVISKTTGTNTDASSITSSDTVYVDWAYINNGQGETQFHPSASIYLDGTLVELLHTNERLQPGSYFYRSDLSLGNLSAGSHALELIVDQPNLIVETNESNADNRVTRFFTVSAPDLRPFTPSGWPGPLVISTQTGTNTNATTITTADTLYIDMKVANVGTGSTSALFYYGLYLDNVRVASIQSGQAVYGYEEGPQTLDYNLGSLAAGTYTLKLRADWTSVISESDESNNDFSKTITVAAGPQPPAAPVTTNPGTTSPLTQPTINCHPTFTWQQVTNANRYGLYVSVDPYQLQNVVFDTESINGGGTTTFEIPPYWLEPNKQYAWDMRAFNSSNVPSGYATNRYFATAGTVLSKPSLVSPSGSTTPGANVNSITPTLKWNRLSGASSYAVIVSAAPHDKNSVVYWSYVNQSSNSTISQQVQSGHLAASTTYAWYVLAYDANGFQSVKSDARYFNTGSSGPLTITLSSPTAGQTFYADALIPVSWSVSGDATALDQFLFAYSTNGGSSFSPDFTITGGANVRSSFWGPPISLNSTTVKIRIRAVNSALTELTSVVSGQFSVIPRPATALNAIIQSPNPSKPVVGQLVTLSGAGSSPVGDIIEYRWDFGDGSASQFGQTVQHAFTKSGNVWVSLTIKKSPTESDKAAIIVFVDGSGLLNASTPLNFSPDPVNLATGNFIMDNVDLSLPGRGLPFQFRRFYNSHAYTPPAAGDPAVVPGPLGYSWRHSFEIVVGPRDEADCRAVQWDDGHVDLHKLVAGEYQPPTGVYDRVVENGDQTLTLTTKAQMRYFFDATGRLTAIKDRNDNTLALTYDLAGRVDFVTLDDDGLPGAAGPAEKIVDFQYNGEGRLVALEHDLEVNATTTPASIVKRRVEFEYDVNQDLTTIRDARGKPTTLVYDALHQIIEGRSAKGHRFVKNEYGTGEYGRAVVKQWDALDHLSRFEYDFATHITRFFDALCENDANRKPEIHAHDEKLRLIKRTDPADFFEEFGYDGRGNRTTVKDKCGNVVTYQYDVKGNVTRKIAPLQDAVKILEDTVITYNALNDPEERTDPSGAITKWEYDLKGNVNAVTFPFIAATPNRYRRTFTVNQFGQVTDKLNARNFNTHIDYDGQGNPWRITDAEDGVTTSYFDLAGRVTRITDALNHDTLYTLDAADHVVLLRRFLDGQPVNTVSAFDDNGNLETVTDANNHTITYFHDEKDRQFKVRAVVNGENLDTVTELDALDRKTKVIDPRGGETRFAYDAGGRMNRLTNAVNEVTDFKHDKNGKVTEVEVVATQKKTLYFYDVLNRQFKVTDANLNSARTEFDLAGRVWKTFDALDRVTVRTYDLAGNLSTVTDPNPTPGALPVEFGYDDENNRTSVKDTRGHTTSYAYDKHNRRTSETLPTDPPTVTQWHFDAVGNLDQIVDGKSQVFEREYDELNRLKKIIYPNGPPVVFGYDPVGNRLSMTDALGTTEWSYDELNRPTSLTDPFGLALSFGYDKSGNRNKIVYPGSRIANYLFDPANRLEKATDWLNREIIQTYDTTGRLDTIALPNGVNTNLGYDNASRLTSITHRKGSDAPFADYTYTLGKTGTVDNTEGAETLAPTFTASATTYTHDNANQLATLNGNPVTHDGNGNLTSARLTPQSTTNDSLTFDFENRLKDASIAGQTTTSTYNGLGHRLVMARGGQTTRFLVDGTAPLAQIMAETDDSGNVTAFYLYAGGLAARILTDGSVSYYHADRRGSTVALTDSAGVVTDRYAYDDFGVPAGSTGSSANPFRYLGRFGVHDTGDGTLFVRARHYHPDLGRFLSRDPLTGRDAQPQSLNRYIYALNNPLALVDVSGFASQEMRHAMSTPMISSDIQNGYLVDSGSRRIPFSGIVHFGLDVVGLGLDFADPINAGLYAYEGDYENAAFSGAASIPAIGIGATIGKWGKNINKAYDGASEVKFFVRRGEDTLEKLTEQAVRAEKTGEFPHGVSVTGKNRLSGTDKVNRAVTADELLKVFEVVKTGENSSHYTVILPKPVTEEVLDAFNSLFK